MCFDTTESANYIQKMFDSNVQNTCKLMCHAVSDKFTECFTNQNQNERRQNSSFSKFEDDDDDFSYHNEATFVMDQAKEPVDICWYNMGGLRGIYMWRRVLLLIGCLIIVIFFSTPSSILAAVKKVDILNVAENTQGLVRHYLPVVGNSVV